MLAHGSEELEALAEFCDIDELGTSNGWRTDLWVMTDDAVDAAIAAYEALLVGSSSGEDSVIALLEADGINLAELLLDPEQGNDLVTRADLCELVAASSLIATDGCDTDRMHMPNVPKMSRRKSDSGVDIFDVDLDPHSPEDDLGQSEHLVIASVKHTVTTAVGDLRRKLINSATEELTDAYMAAQLRVLEGRLVQEGVPRALAKRVYLFLRSFPASEFVEVFAVGVIDPEHEQSMRAQLANLPETDGDNTAFRTITLPELANVHERCP